MSFWNVKDGPVVIDVPPASAARSRGNIVKAWQMPLEDAGPKAPTRARAAKYLIAAAGLQRWRCPGATSCCTPTPLGGFALLRSNLAEPQRCGHREVGGLRQADEGLSAGAGANPPADRVHRCVERMSDSIDPLRCQLLPQPRPRRADRALARRATRAMIDQLRTHRHREGQSPTSADATRDATLDAAVREAGALLAQRLRRGFPP